jgi:hypothetical protein
LVRLLVWGNEHRFFDSTSRFEIGIKDLYIPKDGRGREQKVVLREAVHYYQRSTLGGKYTVAFVRILCDKKTVDRGVSIQDTRNM